MKTKRIILGQFILIFALVSCNKNQVSSEETNKQSKKIRVETVIAQKNDFKEKLSYSGLILPETKIPLNFQIPGTVTKIYVDEGDHVKKGQVLAEIDETSLKSTYNASLAMQNQALDAYNRLKLVYDQGSLPEIKWEEVKSKLEQANSMEIVSKENLKKCKLIAPSNGIIGSKNVEVGATSNPAISALDLITINNVYVKISVPENEINKLKKNQEAKVTIGALGHSSYKAKVDKIGVMANQLSKTYEVKLLMTNPGLIIKPGMVCNIEITVPTDNENITIPIQSIQKDYNGDEYVYVIDKNTNKANKVIVKTGEILQNKVQILSGISKGELVVVKGQNKLKNNDSVIHNEI